MTTAIQAGQWLHNPVTGELGRVRVAPAESGGMSFEGDVWLTPGAAVNGEHTHPFLIERFEVIEGAIGYTLDGRPGVAGPGESFTIPARTRHAWWNAGRGRSQARFRLDSVDPARPMADRFLSMIEVGWGLGAAGKTNAKGMPRPLWLAALAHEYRDVLRFTKPPAVVQDAIFGPLSALARATGHDPLADWLHGPAGPASIPSPEAVGLAELVAA